MILPQVSYSYSKISTLYNPFFGPSRCLLTRSISSKASYSHSIAYFLKRCCKSISTTRVVTNICLGFEENQSWYYEALTRHHKLSNKTTPTLTNQRGSQPISVTYWFQIYPKHLHSKGLQAKHFPSKYFKNLKVYIQTILI